MRKIFTLLTAALLTLAANASIVTWDYDFLYDDLWIYAENGVVEDEENNTLDGITATASSVIGNIVFWDNIVFENGGGTITFTSSIGDISKIEILGSKTYEQYNSETYNYDVFDNFTGTISGDEWTITLTDKNTKKVATWSGTPSTSVNLTSADLEINDIISIVFTIADEHTITFAKEGGVDGDVPATIKVVPGESFTVPVNRTLYKEGYTLTGWNDGTTTRLPGAVITPDGDMTLTAMFTQNTKDLSTTSSAVTVTWEFGIGNGAPSVSIEGNTGILVAQASVGGETQDIKLDIDATSSGAKFKTIGNTECANVFENTIFSLPNKEGVTVEVKTSSSPGASTFGGSTYSSIENHSTYYVATYSTDDVSDPVEFQVLGGSLYFYLKACYPSSSSSPTTGIENTVADEQPVKRLIDGNILIFRGGKVYSLMGQEVK